MLTTFELLSKYDDVVEVGVGNRADLAGRLAEHGVSVVATDVVARQVPEGVAFVVDDVTDPGVSVYEGAGAVYARRLPPELQRPVRAVAHRVGADLYFTTLGADPAVVPADPRTVESGTVFVDVPDQ